MQDSRSPYTVESQIEIQANALHRMADQGSWKRRTVQVYAWLCILGPLVRLISSRSGPSSDRTGDPCRYATLLIRRISSMATPDASRRVGVLVVVDRIDVSTRVEWPVYVGLTLLAGWLVWILVAPDYWWRKERALVGWQYQDGHRIELSTAGRIWVRFWVVVTLVILCVVGGATINWTAASRVRTEPLGGLGGTVYYVGDPVQSPGCTVRVVVCLRSDQVFPIEVTGYKTVEPGSDRHPTGVESLPDDTNLLLYVPWQFFPTRIVVDDGDEQVTVTVHGKCAPWRLNDPYGRSPADCATDPAAGPHGTGVVPVSLDEQLGARALIDGSREIPIPPAT